MPRTILVIQGLARAARKPPQDRQSFMTPNVNIQIGVAEMVRGRSEMGQPTV